MKKEDLKIFENWLKGQMEESERLKEEAFLIKNRIEWNFQEGKLTAFEMVKEMLFEID